MQILTGHAYLRALRAHILAHATLICDYVSIQEEVCGGIESQVFCSAPSLRYRGATLKLWVQYFEIVTLIKLFIEAERTSGTFTFKWTKGMTSVHNIGEEIKKMCGVAFTRSEQHVEMREARIKRDSTNSEKLIEWFMQHYPFLDVSEILSLSTVVVGDSSINCHMSKEIGLFATDTIVGGDFQNVKFYIHAVDKDDKMANLRPLIGKVNEHFVRYTPVSKDMSIDSFRIQSLDSCSAIRVLCEL
ncbi:hypothetical protein ILUMI_20208 [Ignelater luminosus]|uniref:Uncharacterized protein n=1 Tax=Ignelater luminosus TaxID=2038154 RepID=A0A8K0CEN5_IGNLU|nr:hypothetical protein ILUMI_20208 [Ignelater luminosus]